MLRVLWRLHAPSWRAVQGLDKYILDEFISQGGGVDKSKKLTKYGFVVVNLTNYLKKCIKLQIAMLMSSH